MELVHRVAEVGTRQEINLITGAGLSNGSAARKLVQER
jgi:hypothetical protein